MPEMKSYEPGQFCWIDLATTDVDAAKAFYSELFGWKLTDVPAGDAGTYTMASIDDKQICGMSAQPDMMKGMPPVWTSYVSVQSADDSAKKAESLGGKAIAPPFDVMDAGRMAIIGDPTGGVLGLWQAKEHRGTMLANEPGSLCWNELNTHDTDKAKAFYTDLFGWNAKSDEGGPMPYTQWYRGEGTHPAGGMMKIGEHMGPNYKDIPAHWAVYFAVANAEESANRIKSLGGKLLVEPKTIPGVGTFAVAQDPQGGAFCIIKLEPK